MSARPVPTHDANGLAYLGVVPPPKPTGPKPNANPAGLVYLQPPAAALPAMPAKATPAAPGARIVDAKELHQLRTHIWALRTVTPLVFLILTFLAASAVSDSHEPLLGVGAVWAAISWPLLSWAIWQHRKLAADLANSAIVVEGGVVTAATTVRWTKRSTEAIVGFVTYRITRPLAYLAVRRTHGTAGDHVALALAISVAAGVAAWAVAKKVIEGRAAVAAVA